MISQLPIANLNLNLSPFGLPSASHRQLHGAVGQALLLLAEECSIKLEIL
jgi:hypothetical protein